MNLEYFVKRNSFKIYPYPIKYRETLTLKRDSNEKIKLFSVSDNLIKTIETERTDDIQFIIPNLNFRTYFLTINNKSTFKIIVLD